jgi:GNAT superfamily N-acetyltransferase
MMRKEALKSTPFKKLSRLYSEMEETYNRTAGKIGLSCHGCPDNCCTSHFQHHTYIEWAYLWKGIGFRPDEKQRELMNRAGEYVRQSRALLAQGLRPRIMCPLNDNGLCQLYEYRLMVCRMHGVPNSFVRPDGKRLSFPGCFRCQELYSHLKEVPVLDRTAFYRDLASLEMAFVGPRIKTLPRVNLTLAEMLVQGPPGI